jgi:ERCC4-type nuclease
MSAVAPLPALPALRSLGDLRDLRPTIIVDSREQDPLVFHRLPSVRGTLQSGDYGLAGAGDALAVERKTVADLVGCCVGDNRERFERELHRLRGCRFARLLIVGERASIERGEFRSRIAPASVLHSLAAWEARYVPVVFCPTPEAAGEQVETWCYWYARELVQCANWLLRGNREGGTMDQPTATHEAEGGAT